MSKRQWLCVMGVWVMAFLFLGFPASSHKTLAIITGVIIIAISYNLPQEQKKDLVTNDSAFVENDNKEKVQ